LEWFQVGKRLLIQWDGKTLHDGEVDEIVWSDSDSGVSVQGKSRRAGVKRTPGGGGILEALASARKQQTAKEADERRAAAAAEADLPPEVVGAVEG
jgi:hypothetical protein